MKKFLSITLLTLYLVASIGITITMHYCGDNLASLAISEKVSCCCEKEIAPTKKDDCCKNDFKQIKIKDEQIKAEFQVLEKAPQQLPIFVAHFYSFEKNNFTKLAKYTHTNLPKPPNISNEIPVYKRNHSFLFYS